MVLTSGVLALLLTTTVTHGLFFHQGQSREEILSKIHAITTNNIGNLCHQKTYEFARFPISINVFSASEKNFVLMSRFLGLGPYLLKDKNLIRSALKILIQEDDDIDEVRFVGYDDKLVYSISESSEQTSPNFQETTLSDEAKVAPWFIDRHSSNTWLSENFIADRRLLEIGGNPGSTKSSNVSTWWTYPYYSCQKAAWTISFMSPIYSRNPGSPFNNATGLLVFDQRLSGLDINQCSYNDAPTAHTFHESSVVRGTGKPLKTINHFAGTHKCHRETSWCTFDPGHGWTKGGYSCQCRAGFYGSTGGKSFNGSLVEVAWRDKLHEGSDAYDLLYECRPCAEGCQTCTDASACLASYNWIFRWILLLISISCVFLSLVMIGLVYKFRRDKVFKLASPTFLSITLVGCAIMYLEMVAIFPYLNMPFCIATKWTRNMGFLVTYSALLMKTWRVSLTFRVKSAHKLKLTDNQLLQWFFPILLIMVIYLCSWTFSDPPQAVFIEDSNDLKFKQCHFGWWDLILSAGEIVFLFWGIRVCFSVRKARTHFGEARLIRWSIYNIASVNLVMVSIHVFLFPHAGPDMKYFLGFLRTQMSTTTTIILVLGTKFWRIYNGTANDLDDQLRAKGNTACMFSIPFDDNEEPKDLACENEELKEEIQKLASQIQYLRIVGMLTANFHCKNKNNFSLENSSKVFQENLEACLQNGSLSTASFHRTLSLNQPKGARGNRLKSHQPLTGTSSCSVQIHKYRSNNRRSLGTFSPSGLPMSEANHSMRIKADVGSRSVCIADPASSARPVLSYLPASRGAPEHHRHGLEANVEEYVVTSPSGRVISSPLDTLGDREGKARPTLVHLKNEACQNLLRESKNV